MKHRLAMPLAAELLCCLLVSGPASADPMRPLHQAAPAGAAATTSPTGTNANGGAEKAPPSHRLTAIRQSSEGLRTALFGQRWLQVGDMLSLPDGDTRVVKIGTHQVDLVRNRVASTIYLLPPLQPSQPMPVTTPATNALSATPFGTPPSQAKGPDGKSDPDHNATRTQGSGTP